MEEPICSYGKIDEFHSPRASLIIEPSPTEYKTVSRIVSRMPTLGSQQQDVVVKTCKCCLQ